MIFHSYFSSCQTVLIDVCEALMFSIPVELGGSPGMSSPILNFTSDDPASRTQQSLQRIVSAPWPKSAKQRYLFHVLVHTVHNKYVLQLCKSLKHQGSLYLLCNSSTWGSQSHYAIKQGY